jgi:hypothetical protein
VDLDSGAHHRCRVKLIEGSHRLLFFVRQTRRDWPVAGNTGMELRALEYTNVPDIASHSIDGSEEDAHAQQNYYLPMHTGPAGLGFSASVRCEVRTGGATGAAGFTPSNLRGSRHYFVGRTLVYMGHAATRVEQVRIAVHELCHGFGLPHNCGRTTADPTSGMACAMTVLDQWLFSPGTATLSRWYWLPPGPQFCEYHLRALRHVHLEDNPALWSW